MDEGSGQPTASDASPDGPVEMDRAWLVGRLQDVGADAVISGVVGRLAAAVPAATDAGAAPAAGTDADHESAAPIGLAALADPVALLFDLDGTLVDTVQTRIEAWMEAFARVGIPADRKHVAGLIGADGKRLAREVAAIAGRTLNDDKAEAIDRYAGERYDALNTDPRPLPGATELLTALEAGDLPWCVATSSRAEQVKKSVEALKLPKPPPIVDGSHVRHAKPSPDLLLLAAERLHVPARGCWYVGDATWDMRAARGAAMLGVGVPTGAVSATELERAGAKAVIRSLEELAADLVRRGIIRS